MLPPPPYLTFPYLTFVPTPTVIPSAGRRVAPEEEGDRGLQCVGIECIVPRLLFTFGDPPPEGGGWIGRLVRMKASFFLLKNALGFFKHFF